MDKKTINGIRKYYQLPIEVTDKQIARKLKGSIGEVVVNLNIAKKDMVKAFGEVAPRILRRYLA